MSGSDTDFDSFGYIHLLIRTHTFTHSDTDIYSFGYRHLIHSDIDVYSFGCRYIYSFGSFNFSDVRLFIRIQTFIIHSDTDILTHLDTDI